MAKVHPWKTTEDLKFVDISDWTPYQLEYKSKWLDIFDLEIQLNK